MNSVISDILLDAEACGKLNFLQILHSYEKVITSKKILYYSEEGAEIYKTLLQWGRETTNWEQKYKEFLFKPSKLQVSDLIIQEPASKKDQSVTLKQISFPSLKEFDKKEKTKNPKFTVALAFFHRSLKRRAWGLFKKVLVSAKEERRKESKKLEKKEKKLKSEKLFNLNTSRKAFEAWTNFNLFQLRKKISEQVDRQTTTKRFWKNWKNAMRKREILKGMKYTASFIHSQWLMKKVFLVMTRYVHKKMIEKLKIGKIQLRTNENLVVKALVYWKRYVNISLFGKVLKLKSEKLLIQNCKKRGFLKFFLGCEINKDCREKEELARRFWVIQIYQKVLGSWFRFSAMNKKKLIKTQKALNFNNRQIARSGFEWMRHVVDEILEKRENCLKILKQSKKRNILKAWKAWVVSNIVLEYPEKFYFFCYLTMGELEGYGFGDRFEFVKTKKLSFASGQIGKHIKRQLFDEWKKNIKRVKVFKEKKTLRKKIEVFVFWKDRSQRKGSQKTKISRQVNSKKAKVLKKIFTAWAKTYLKIRINKLIFKQNAIEKQEKMLKKSLGLWLKKMRKRVRHKFENSLVPVFYRQNLLNKYVRNWTKQFKKVTKKRYLSHKSQLFYLEKFSLKSWKIWKAAFLAKIKLNYKSVKVADDYSSKLLSKMFQFLKRKTALSKSKSSKKFKALDQHEWVLKVKTIRSWKLYKTYVHSKNVLYTQLDNDRKNRLTRKILKYLKIYAQYRLKNKARDKITNSQLIKNRKKYLMKFWYNKALLFSSVRYFETIFKRLLQKEVINSIQKFIEIQKVTLAYLEVFREESRVKTVFNAWRRVLNKKKVLARNIARFKKVEEKYSKLKPFKTWNKKFLKNKMKIQKFGRLLNKSFVFFMRISFFNWKKEMMRFRKRKESLLHRGKYLKKQAFRVLLENKTGMEQKNEIAAKYAGERIRILFANIFFSWNKLVFLSKKISSKKKENCSIYFKAFLETVKRRRYLSDIKEKLVIKINRKKLEFYFDRLKKNFRQEMSVKELKEKVENSRKKSTLRKAFYLIKENKINRLLNKKKKMVAGSKYGKFLIKKCFNLLISHKNLLKTFYENKKTSQSTFIKKKYFNILKKISEDSAKGKINEKKIQGFIKSKFFNRLVLLKNFFQFSKKKIQEKQSKNLIRNSFSSLLSYKTSKIKKQLNQRKSQDNFTTLLKSKVFKVLKNNRLKSQSVKSEKTQKISSKILERILKSLNSESGLNKTQKTSLAIATAHNDTSILSKSFNILLKNKQVSKLIKSRISSGFLKISTLLVKKLLFFNFSIFYEVHLDDIKKNIKANKHFSCSAAAKSFKKIKKYLENKKNLLKKQELIQLKSKKLLKRKRLSQWIKALNVKVFSKHLKVKYHYCLVQDIFSKWLTELKIKEIHQNRVKKLKVYSLAGLQIYAEKSFQAKAHIKNLNVIQSFKLMKDVFSFWFKYKTSKQLSRYYTELHNTKLKKISLASLKDYFYQSLIEKEVFGRCSKNLTVRMLNKWRIALKRRGKGKKLLKNSLIRKYLQVQSVSFFRWYHQDLTVNINKTMIIKSLRGRRINKEEALIKSSTFFKENLVSKVFYAWDTFVSNHSIKRRRAFVHSIFLGWKLITRENSLLRKYLIESNLSERYLRSSVEGLGVFKSMSSLGSFQSVN